MVGGLYRQHFMLRCCRHARGTAPHLPCCAAPSLQRTQPPPVQNLLFLLLCIQAFCLGGKDGCHLTPQPTTTQLCHPTVHHRLLALDMVSLLGPYLPPDVPRFHLPHHHFPYLPATCPHAHIPTILLQHALPPLTFLSLGWDMPPPACAHLPQGSATYRHRICG